MILTKYEAVHKTVVSEHYFFSGMLIVLIIRVQKLSIHSNNFAYKFTHIVS